MLDGMLWVVGLVLACALGACVACWRLRDRVAGASSFMANLRAVLRTGGQGEER